MLEVISNGKKSDAHFQRGQHFSLVTSQRGVVRVTQTNDCQSKGVSYVIIRSFETVYLRHFLDDLLLRTSPLAE